MKRVTLFITILMSSILGGGITLGTYLTFFPANNTIGIPSKSANLHYTKVSTRNQSSQDEEQNSSLFVKAAANSTPSVVHIKTSIETSGESNQREQLLEELFGFRREPGQEKRQSEGSGSGVIISSDGYIVTNNHVIDHSNKIEVTLYDNRTLEAKLIGTDSQTDLALLKIDVSDLDPMPFGYSDDVQVGEWVLAVGNPFNLTSTVTSGIVSAKARNIRLFSGSYGIESFIQTDAAVNPGNSGGALVNLQGELIGINTAIASPNGSYAGYAFAIPSSIVQKVTKDLKEYGAVQRALLGVSIRDITSELQKEKDLERLNGVYVEAVQSGGSADKSGIKSGDIITKIDGQEVNKVAELQESIAIHRPGDEVNVSLIRKGKEINIEATLLNMMGDLKEINYNLSSMVDFGGASFADLEKEKKEKLELDYGVEIIKIGDGIWKKAGIKKGFIITSIDRKKTKDTKNLISLLRYKKGDAVLVEGIYSNGEKVYYGVPIE